MPAEIIRINSQNPEAGLVSYVASQIRAGQVLAWLQAPDYDTAVADLRKAQADNDAKSTAWKRTQSLHEAGVVATRELESAQADARSAQAEVARAAAHVRALGAGGVASDGRFALRAPIDGVLAERHLNPGQEWRADAADPAFDRGEELIADLDFPGVGGDVDVDR